MVTSNDSELFPLVHRFLGYISGALLGPVKTVCMVDAGNQKSNEAVSLPLRCFFRATLALDGG